MGATKQEILRSSTKLFKERGYLSTSIQDIADDCQIAKGSVYKYFSSKEELFSEVFDQCQIGYFEQVEKLKQFQGFTPREYFRRQILLRFVYFMEYKHILVDFTELPIHQNTTFHQLRNRTRGRLLNLHKECLLNVYGTEIEPFLWDMVFIYRAILKAYLSWIIHEVNLVSLEDTAHFIVDKMDALVRHMIATQSRSLLDQVSFDHFINWGLEGRKEEKEQVISELIKKIDILITEIPTGETHRQELKEILSLLKAEIGKPNPNDPLTQALLSYLEKESELKVPVTQLLNVLDLGSSRSPIHSV